MTEISPQRDGCSVKRSGVLGKDVVDVLFHSGLEGIKRGQWFAAGVHFDVQLIRQIKVAEVEKLESNVRGLRLRQPVIKSAAFLKLHMDCIKHFQCRQNGGILPPK